MYVPAQSPPPSAQAMDLGQRITDVVRQYLAENPGVGSTDVTQAFAVARRSLRSELGVRGSRVLILLLVGLAVLGVVTASVLLEISGDLDARLPSITLGIAILAVAAVAAAVAKRNR
jgi:hypothetical protein